MKKLTLFRADWNAHRGASETKAQEDLVSLHETKFFLPVSASSLIARPRLTDMLEQGRKRPLTLLSGPAGSGKTTLVSTWAQTCLQRGERIIWISLEEEDNDPVCFWIEVFASLSRKEEEIAGPLLTLLGQQQEPPLQYILTEFINMMVLTTEPTYLILDGYQVITTPSIHASLAYLLDHLPPQLHIVIVSCTEPPLPLARLRVRRQILDISAEQLRCTPEEVALFFKEVMAMPLNPDMLQSVYTQTGGSFFALQFLRLSVKSHTEHGVALQAVGEDQHNAQQILIDEVFSRQSPQVQAFLLSTCVLDRFCVSLCDAVIQQSESQRILDYLEHTDVLVMPLDSQHHWYRYQTLFVEALRSRLSRLNTQEVCQLHQRASGWYARHGYVCKAIEHALLACEWQQVADLIEATLPLDEDSWYERGGPCVQRWLQQLPVEIVRARPYLCLAYARALHLSGQTQEMEPWLQAAEAALEAGDCTARQQNGISTRQQPEGHEREKLLGELAAMRAFVAANYGERQAIEGLSQLALASLLGDDFYEHALVAYAQALADFNDGQAVAATQHCLESSAFYQAAGATTSVIAMMSIAALPLFMRGQLRTVWQLCQHAIDLAGESSAPPLAPSGLALAYQAEVLREHNQLDAAIDFALRGRELLKRPGYHVYTAAADMILVSIYLSRAEIGRAHETMNRVLANPLLKDSPYNRAWLTSVEQVRLWLALGELEKAIAWTEEVIGGKRVVSLLAREREAVACARVRLAQKKPAEALSLLEPFIDTASQQERWDHVIEMRLLQALAHSMCNEVPQALFALSQAVLLAEPECYVRRFVDEGTPLEELLSTMREQEEQQGSTPYLDLLLAAFAQRSISEREEGDVY